MEPNQTVSASQWGRFSSVETAEKAISELLAAGFAVSDLVVICAEEYRDQFRAGVQVDQPPSEGAPMLVPQGALAGAALGGVAWAVASLATGGAALIPGALVLVGGGAMAGGIGNLIASDGYRPQEFDEFVSRTIEKEHIVVGVRVAERSIAAERNAIGILRGAGALSLLPQNDPAVKREATV